MINRTVLFAPTQPWERRITFRPKFSSHRGEKVRTETRRWTLGRSIDPPPSPFWPPVVIERFFETQFLLLIISFENIEKI